MRDLVEYSSNTSDSELFSFFYDRIISGEITTFSSLKKLATPVISNRRSHPVILRAFGLVKTLNWGFFSAITPTSHGKLWKELVIPDKDFPNAGDLKRTLQISNLYIAMLDIHGYTRFCMDARKNLSMMHTLDRAIEYEVSRISTACGAVSQRERGDEMVVVAASATDAITVTLSIIDYFGKTNVVKDPAIITERSADTVSLPKFKISGGITGGNTTSPLIMTEKGYLSGFLLNSGARLQVRANELSPMESRVMIAKQVQLNFLKENVQTKCTLIENNAVYFFDTGQIEFKGVMIPACEVVFDENDRYKEKISTEMNNLIESTGQNLWEQRIFTDLTELLIKVSQVMPKFTITPAEPIEGMPMLSNESLENLSKKATVAYVKEDDYVFAISLLQRLIEVTEMIPSFDRLVLDYLKGISEKYTLLIDSFNEYIDQQINLNASEIFQGNLFPAWDAAKKGVLVHKKLLEQGRNSKVITRRKNLWYGLMKQKQSDMAFTLYSGKK